jgi:hypothetical protein
MNSAPDQQSGAASGINNAASRLASLFAVAIIGATASLVFHGRIGGIGTISPDLRFGPLPDSGQVDRLIIEPAFVYAYGSAMYIAVGWALLAAFVAIFFLRPRPEGGLSKFA